MEGLEAVVSIVTVVITALGTLVVKHFLDGWKESRKGRKDEAQRIAHRLDDALREVEDVKVYKRDLEAAFHALRIRAIQEGVPDDEIHVPRRRGDPGRS